MDLSPHSTKETSHIASPRNLELYCWRFTANQRVEVSDALHGVIRHLFKSKRWKKKPVVLALDWVEVRNFHTLVLAVVRQGRAIPLLWASYPEWELTKNQNNLEEGLLRLFKTLLPSHVRVILLADRGFGRAECWFFDERLVALGVSVE